MARPMRATLDVNRAPRTEESVDTQIVGVPGESPSTETDAPLGGVPDEAMLIEALKRGDEQAFVTLVQAYHALLIRLALFYVPNRAVAEDVVQETWLGVLNGLGRFEARSSLKTWICRILTNRARTRAQREGRSVPFSSFWTPDDEHDEPTVDPSRFRTSDPYEGHWAARPTRLV